MSNAGNEGDVSLEGYQRDAMRDRVGRHMRQSAWLAEHVYGSRGASWRALFAREPLARELGALWYSGSSLAWTEKARLGTKLALALASG
jgi:hypothetical protein